MSDLPWLPEVRLERYIVDQLKKTHTVTSVENESGTGIVVAKTPYGEVIKIEISRVS